MCIYIIFVIVQPNILGLPGPVKVSQVDLDLPNVNMLLHLII